MTHGNSRRARKLGTGADGHMLFPLGRDNQYIYRLSPRVITDWDRFLALATHANTQPPDQAVDLLDQALALIDGPPFRAATGYSWAYSDGTATLITETIKAAARHCVDLHIAHAEFLDAGRAAAKAARATDTADGEDPLVRHVVAALRGHDDRNAADCSP